MFYQRMAWSILFVSDGGAMKEIVGLFLLLYSLGQVALDREKPEEFLYKLDRYSRGQCVSTGRYAPAEKSKRMSLLMHNLLNADHNSCNANRKA
jgi:hypothetical protein